MKATQHMTTSVQSLTARPAWKALQAHYHSIRDMHLRTLFANDPARDERMTAEAVGIIFDYSKNRIADETRKQSRAQGHDSSTNCLIRHYRMLKPVGA